MGAQEAYSAWTDGQATIVDVREQDEHDVTHIEGVPLIPMSELLERMEELPDGPIVVMCRSGARSASVAQYLEEHLGRTGVANLEGGIIAWAASGLPFEGDPPR